MKRDNEGRIILDNFKKIDDYVEGRKRKQWLISTEEGNETKYLFKYDSINYELYSELIASELAKQIGLEAANYDLATLNGINGLLTQSFLRQGDILVSGREVLADGAKIAKVNNLGTTIGLNSLDSIVTSLSLRYNFTNINEIITDLLKMWCLDLLILESDRNETNWSIISNPHGIRLAPIYDSSNMCFLNNDISSYINSFRSYDAISSLIDSTKFNMAYRSELANESSLVQFSMLCQENMPFVESVIPLFEQINVDKAIEAIEKRHNENKEGDKPFEIPPIVSIWVSKIIEFRKKDLLGIYNYEKRKIEEKRR